MISFEVNEKTPKLRFLASLSDGKTVIEDYIPGKEHAWYRLQNFLKENKNIKITGLRLQHIKLKKDIAMPSNQPGYFLGKKMIKVYPAGGQQEYIGIGYYDGNLVTINWLLKPSLEKSKTETKTAQKSGAFLIVNQ